MGWYVLSKYYGMSDATPAYAAATLLNPSKRAAYLDKVWLPEWKPSAIEDVEKLWTSKYKSFNTEQSQPEIHTTDSDKELTVLERLEIRLSVVQKDTSDVVVDDIIRFIEDKPIDMGRDPNTKKKLHPLQWWLLPEQRCRYPRLSRIAIDIFSIAPISDEPERVFSSSRRTISCDRYSLSPAMIEMLECLGHWIDNGNLRLAYGGGYSVDLCWKYGFVVSPIISSFDIHVVYSTRSTLRCESRCVSRCTRSEMRLFSGAAEPQEYGYLYRSICHDVQNKIKQFILFHAAHTITILILVISSI